MGQTEVREPDRRQEQELDGALDVVVREVERGAPRRTATVVDEDVDPAEGLEGLLHQTLEILRICQVAADSEGSDPLGLARELVPAAGEHGDIRSLAGERLGDREAHA